MNQKLITKTAVLLISLFVGHLVIGIFFAFSVKYRSELLKQERQLFEKKDTFDYLFMGSSHVVHGIDDNVIKNSYKLAFGGENNIRAYYKLKKYLEHASSKPKYVVLPHDVLEYTNGLYKNMKYNYYYSDIIDIKELWAISRDWKITLWHIIYSVIPYIEWKEITLKYFEKMPKENMKYFSIKKKTEESNIQEAKKLMIKALPDGKEKIYSSVSLSYLDKTLSMCQKNNIKVILLRYPMSDYFTNALSEATGQKMISRTPIDDIVKKYANNCAVINYEYDFATCHEYFTDSHHLNETGKYALSVHVNNDLKALRKQRNW